MGLHQFVQEPTRESNILDLCIASNDSMIENLEIHDNFSTSDHAYFTCDIRLWQSRDDSKSWYYNFDSTDWELVHSYMMAVDFDSLMENGDINFKWNALKEILTHILDQHVMKNIIKRKNNAPWFKRDQKKLIQKKEEKWRKMKHDPTDANKRSYKSICNNVKTEIKKAKSEYERNIFQSKPRSKKYFYSYVDRSTKQRNEIPPLLLPNGVLTENDEDKANALMNQYESVFVQDNGILPDGLQRIPPNSLCDLEITEQEILKSISEMSSSTASGPDRIHPVLVKKLQCHLIKPLMTLFTSSLRQGDVPND